ncbi:glycosyltransferase [Cellulomonas sp. zg-ZUI199]|uniref:Glycosyltransferase n=1 Tax=Cellulomonas wangleii TaxID=2816956 RepID=A0ABX8D634_9CELL|nr:glycosyltransferase [Cellulomonas wangleii]MBO0925288.1 glycosyltransferase [Cellulomonas wangleii]QVI61212.1 glycosyltransferase [Cellulomonas wangleii]
MSAPLLLSLLVDAGHDAAALERTLASVHRQDDEGWEVVVAGDAEPADDRVRVVPLAGLTPLEAARRAARGTYVAVVGAGDELEPGALAAVRMLLAARPATDLVYTDEQWPSPDGSGIRMKPDHLPRLDESLPYVGRLAFHRAQVLERAGGFDGPEGAQEYDAVLRVTEFTDAVAHVPAVALTRAHAPRRDPAADRAAVEGRLERTGRHGRVEDAPAGGTRTWLDVTEPPLVSIVVPTAGGRRRLGDEDVLLVERCLRSVRDRTTYDRWEVVLVTSEGTPEAVVAGLRADLGDRLVHAPVPGAFNFSTSVNHGAGAARGELLLLLNDDTEVVEPRWLERMVSVAADPSVGVVGAKLLFAEGTVQHVGITVDDELFPIHALGSEVDDDGAFGAKVLDTDWAAVTGACLLTPRDVFVEVGGFDPALPLNFNDVDYCYKVRLTGRAVVTAPFAVLHHYESSTRGHRLEDWEVRTLAARWFPVMRSDPHLQYRTGW